MQNGKLTMALFCVLFMGMASPLFAAAFICPDRCWSDIR